MVDLELEDAQVTLDTVSVRVQPPMSQPTARRRLQLALESLVESQIHCFDCSFDVDNHWVAQSFVYTVGALAADTVFAACEIVNLTVASFVLLHHKTTTRIMAFTVLVPLTYLHSSALFYPISNIDHHVHSHLPLLSPSIP